jgi:hypothetical protein
MLFPSGSNPTAFSTNPSLSFFKLLAARSDNIDSNGICLKVKVKVKILLPHARGGRPTLTNGGRLSGRPPTLNG